MGLFTPIQNLLGLANTWAANQVLNGTNNTAPNQTAAGSSSLMTRSLIDTRTGLVNLGGYATNGSTELAQSAAIVGGINPTSLKYRGSLASNNTSYYIGFKPTQGGENSIGLWSIRANGTTKTVNPQGVFASRGNQGDTQISSNGVLLTNSTYYISWATPVTLTGSIIITGSISGATGVVDPSSAGASKTNAWLYNLTGIFTTADVLSISGGSGPTGQNVAGTSFGGTPSTNSSLAIYCAWNSGTSLYDYQIFNANGAGVYVAISFES